MSLALDVARPAPVAAPPASSEGFFTHHGLWAPGVRLFRRLRFSAKAAIISLAVLVPMLGLLAWMLHAQFEDALHARMDATRQHVEVAHGVLEWAYRRESTGELSRAQAQQLATQLIGGLRYDGNEYFWINDMQPRMVMHPIKPALNGQDLGAMKDPNGFALFAAMAATVRAQGQGYVAYQWPKPGAERPVDKVSYVKGFAPWGWIVGSGVYTDDLRQAALGRLKWIALVVVPTLLLTAYLFLSFFHVIEGGLRETRRHLRAMTAGDLTTSPMPWGRDEAAQLMNELRRMQDSLRSVVAQVRQSSQGILVSSQESAQGALDLSTRTEQAAAQLERSASSMEEISATIKSSADVTTEAAQEARRNADSATAGGQVVREVVETMEGIRASSARIGEIIGTIDGLAFQTNILALNAAVEAARAGEQGRGFAVVAGEVRSLAQRSASAAREIKTLIGSSVDQVEAGAGIVRRAGETIASIVTSSHRVDELLEQVSRSAREQSSGIGLLSQTLQELDRMTQQNAALVEQTAAASASMRDQADRLAGEVAQFRLPAAR